MITEKKFKFQVDFTFTCCLAAKRENLKQNKSLV